MGRWTLRRHGDATLAVELEQRIDPEVNAHVLAIADSVRRARHEGVRDVVEGYASVTVVFDPLRTDITAVSVTLSEAATRRQTRRTLGRHLTVPVCYGGEFGPDLSVVAQFAGCDEQEVVALHTQATYLVYMLGFLPGFAYLGSVADQIAAPRRKSPRVRVPAGSVGVAGRQTGVYPLDAPGGWQLIGRCPLRIFNLDREDPFFLHVGDRVSFTSVGEAEYAEIVGSAHRD